MRRTDQHASEVAEMALAHAVGDATEAAYRRGDLFEKRRALMDLWAAFIDSEPAKGNVRRLRGNAAVRLSTAKKRSPVEVWPAEVLVRAALDPLARQLLIHEINDQLQAYARTANQVHFWRAWLVARRSGIEVPEAMLRTVDRLAEEACSAGRPAADTQMEQMQRMRSVWVAACQETGQALDSTIKPVLSNKVAGVAVTRRRCRCTAHAVDALVGQARLSGTRTRDRVRATDSSHQPEAVTSMAG